MAGSARLLTPAVTSTLTAGLPSRGMTVPVTDLPFTKHPAMGRYTRTRDIRETSRVGSPVDGRERQQTTKQTYAGS